MLSLAVVVVQVTTDQRCNGRLMTDDDDDDDVEKMAITIKVTTDVMRAAQARLHTHTAVTTTTTCAALITIDRRACISFLHSVIACMLGEAGQPT